MARPISDYKYAIMGNESGGNYGAIGPVVDGDRAYGAYQVMGDNVGPWTERWYGRRLTPQEFLSNREAQDAVFEGEFGDYVSRFGEEDAAVAWFAGPGAVGRISGSASDGYTTVSDYVAQFNEALGSAPKKDTGIVATAGDPPTGRRPVFLERIRDRRRDAGMDTSFLDSVINNRIHRSSQPGPLSWLRDLRQQAGYETPFLDRILGGRPETPAASPTPVKTSGPVPPAPVGSTDTIAPLSPIPPLPVPRPMPTSDIGPAYDRLSGPGTDMPYPVTPYAPTPASPEKYPVGGFGYGNVPEAPFIPPGPATPSPTGPVPLTPWEQATPPRPTRSPVPPYIPANDFSRPPLNRLAIRQAEYFGIPIY